MAIKAVLDSLDNVPDALKGEYKKNDDGKFYLDLEGVDDHHAVGALKRAKGHEVEQHKATKTKLTTAESRVEELEGQLQNALKGYVPEGNVTALENSYKTQLATKESAWAEEKKVLEGNLRTLLVDNVAHGLAIKIAAKPEFAELLLPHIAKRVTAESIDGQYKTRILDKDGKPSALSLEDLEKEMLQTAAFAPILIGTQANGAGGGSGSGGGASKKFSDLSEPERRDLYRKNPAEYNRLKEADKADKK